MKALLMGLLLLPMSVLAGQVELNWTMPTEREDNTPLAVGEIGGVNVYNRDTGEVLVDTMSNVATNVVIDLPNGATYNLVTTVYDTDGRESIYSNEVNVALDHAAPKPTTGLTATVLP